MNASNQPPTPSPKPQTQTQSAHPRQERLITPPRGQILIGDVRQQIERLPPDCIDTIVTSPPYFRLRNYQHHSQIGLEPTVQHWVDELRLVASGLQRVLKPTGSLWLNLGDSYSRKTQEGALPKSLLLAPERLALSMIDDGWYLRNKIIWAKPNPMPSSVKDRLSSTWEVIYCFTRAQHYFYDLDAVRVPHSSAKRTHLKRRHLKNYSPAIPPQWRAPHNGAHNGLSRLKASGQPGHPLGKNPGDVWVIPTAGYRGAHHAVYPEALVEKALLAGCPEKVCTSCDQPWQRQPHRVTGNKAKRGQLEPACNCNNAGTKPGLVLDPFFGSGTTAVAAERLGRDWTGIELNPQFALNAQQRIEAARQDNKSI